MMVDGDLWLITLTPLISSHCYLGTIISFTIHNDDSVVRLRAKISSFKRNSGFRVPKTTARIFGPDLSILAVLSAIVSIRQR
ncbi:uncharacterized protein EV420DRAFT_1549577 [Desarmillaria tabescens]|uniref:Uncharacterized protein n=1 Tax=Armillaria tabescens TaxID=1929756 RepID=A0AA39N4K9_ARMTA|nr:uncharacterized protein EV420DRAFT_1549577 [Desarmillaria tabescens]KAK0457248.1 hypothetical protein EV420DRAFT_1549577 [Desarmillaria tabescens]